MFNQFKPFGQTRGEPDLSRTAMGKFSSPSIREAHA